MVSLQSICKQSLKAYSRFIFHDFVCPDHIGKLIEVLQDVESGKLKRVMVLMPPRHGKTRETSIAFPSWFIGKNPRKDIILISYGESLANDIGRRIRDILVTDKYKSIFGSRLARDSTSMKNFHTIQGGSFSATGLGGPITGKGGDIIIIDDLFKNDQEARSINHRKKIISYYENTIFTRQQTKEAAIILVNNRWHENDLVGHLLENSPDEWTIVKFPAISKEGKPLWPERFDLAYFEIMKKTMSIHTFETQYQQEPFAQEGEFIKDADIQRISFEALPKEFDNMVISFDLTFKGGVENDYVVGQCWGRQGPNFYLVDMIRGQWDFTKTLFHVKQFLLTNKNCSNILIEDAANGAAVANVLQKEIPGIQLWKPEGDKVSRLSSVSPFFATHNVFVNKSIPDLAAFIHEMTGFPNANNDDTVDACTMSLINLRNIPESVYFTLGESLY